MKNINFYLVFKNKDNSVVFIERPTLNELYEIITKYKMIEGSYRIIKGSKIV